MFQFKSFYNGGSTQKFCKNHFEDTLGYWCSTVSTTAQWGAGYATFWSTDRYNKTKFESNRWKVAKWIYHICNKFISIIIYLTLLTFNLDI